MFFRYARLLAASALVLLIALAPVAAMAGPREPGGGAGAWLDLLLGRLVSLWAKEGCQVLPDGRPYCPGRVDPSLPATGVEHQPREKASPEGTAAEPWQPGVARDGRAAASDRI